MNSWPVMERELRTEARRPANYWLRWLGAGGLLAMFLLFAGQTSGNLANQGAALFTQMNLTLFSAIWWLAPLLTADALSREKREGTLGLLFLTPLKVHDVVAAKYLVHLLRALSFGLGVIPVMALPVLLGGVTWLDMARFLCLNLAALLLALVAGLLASSLCREWTRSMMTAFLISFLMAFLFTGTQATYRLPGMWFRPSINFSPDHLVSFFGQYVWSRLQILPWLSPGGKRRYAGPWSGPGTNTTLDVLFFSAVMLGLGLITTLVLMRWITRRTGRAWQDLPPSPQMIKLQQTFFQPILWTRWLRQSLRRTLERNPIGWLQQYSTGSRVTKWGWCAVMLLVQTWILSWPYAEYSNWQSGLANLLCLGMAFSAVSSFQRERQTGALELILVTPLTENQIIGGRLLGIAQQFLPALVVLICVQLFLTLNGVNQGFATYAPSPSGSEFLGLVELPVRLVLISLCGIYLALSRWKLITAWILTGLLALVVPGLIAMALAMVTFSPYHIGFTPALRLMVETVMVMWIRLMLQQKLARRQFMLA